ncbi:MAG: DUF3710 domain-containing protein [Intrasporangium sp.]|uniref:DUF3710 domain-containing protein n=1 Tax=Intrasporangium sp. TaxID=1925024 RepID=UPI0026482946|nr:DUF3710 domain-containing protein [Intrasporangium sp.]MDN5798049.1 DUF3710 domain-containing protein [Intrasporangium sp.]
MGLFKRDRSETASTEVTIAPPEPDEQLDEARTEPDPAELARPDGGPWDRSEVSDEADYLNLGSIWLRGVAGMELRLEVNEQEQQITGVTAVLGESAVQLQAFAAPRTEGVWVDIRNEIATTITDSGGTAEVVTGEFGQELQTRMPQAGAEGHTTFVPARFIGVDGPRWFLRAVVSGRAAGEPAEAESIHEVVRSIVVDRGDEAMPPRELLPLRLPEAATSAPPDTAAEPAGPARLDDLNPFERGPEITEVR